jgi:hypothetical protein
LDTSVIASRLIMMYKHSETCKRFKMMQAS